MTLTYDAYRKAPGMNWSTLKHGAASMLHLKHAIDNPSDGDTISRMVLRANHAATLEPEMLALDFAIWKGGDRRGAEWTAFKAANADKTIIKESEFFEARAIAAAIHEHPVAGPMIAGAMTEHSIQWTDEETGVPCKARLDVVRPGELIGDVKGIGTDPRDVTWRTADNLWYGQLAWYQAGVEALTGERLPCWIVPYEPKAPHDVAAFLVSEEWLEPGRALARRLLRQYADCLASGKWPGRFMQPQDLDEPPAKVTAWLDQADSDLVDSYTATLTGD